MLKVISDSYSMVLSDHAATSTLTDRTITELDILQWLKGNETAIEFYAFIHHTAPDGYGHWHLILLLRTKRVARNIVFDMARFWCCDERAFSIQPILDVKSVCNYLTHTGFDNKEELPVSQVITSDSDRFATMRQGILINCLTMEMLLNLVDQCKSVRELYAILGINMSLRYHSLIKDLFDDKPRNKR